MWNITCRYLLAVRSFAGGRAIAALRLSRFRLHCFLGCLHTSRLPWFTGDGSGGSLGVTGPLTGGFHSRSLCVRLLLYRCAGLSLPKKSAGERGPPQCGVRCVLFIITGCVCSAARLGTSVVGWRSPYQAAVKRESVVHCFTPPLRTFVRPVRGDAP